MAGSFHVRRDLMAIGALVVGTIIAGVLSRSHAMTSDAALRKRFSEHRASFDSLATMALADSQSVGVGPVLRRAGVRSVSRERNGEAIWLVVESRDGTRKGYVYSRKPREPVLATLDDAPQYGYVALAPGWFLFLQPAN